MRSGTMAALVVLVGALGCSIAAAEVLKGRVVGVADGDTVTLLDARNQTYKVRLAGIDAPEKRQAFGSRARQNLARMVFREEVSVDWRKHDRYGRIVGRIDVAGTDPGLEQIAAGLAWHYKQYEREQTRQDRALYSEAEEAARARRVGLWADPAPVPPWEFRRAGRQR